MIQCLASVSRCRVSTDCLLYRPYSPILILHRDASHLFPDARWSSLSVLPLRLRMLLLRMPTTPKSHPKCKLSRHRIVYYYCGRFRFAEIAILDLVHKIILPKKQHLDRVANCCGSAPSLVLIDPHRLLLRLDLQKGWEVWRRWFVFPPGFLFLLQWVLFEGQSWCWQNNLYGIQTHSHCME